MLLAASRAMWGKAWTCESKMANKARTMQKEVMLDAAERQRWVDVWMWHFKEGQR